MGFRLAFEGGSASASGPGCTAGRDGSFSDGLFVSVPVTPDVQTLTEAHSAVLLPGMDLDSLKSVLAGEFVNTQSYGAAVRRISLLDMILESIPEKTRETGKDVISLSDALYVRMLCGSLPGREEVDGLVEKIMDCQKDILKRYHYYLQLSDLATVLEEEEDLLDEEEAISDDSPLSSGDEVECGKAKTPGKVISVNKDRILVLLDNGLKLTLPRAMVWKRLAKKNDKGTFQFSSSAKKAPRRFESSPYSFNLRTLSVPTSFT